ncbi:MAG: aryl-sulfate sulfotransferase [Candidatus Aminicenantes bacterium]|jgi:hypothetical protein
MRKKVGIILLAVVVILAAYTYTFQEKTGLVRSDKEFLQGYTLFSPIMLTTTYLIDSSGRVIHTWDSDFRPGQSVYLMENGHLLRTICVDNPGFPEGGAGGGVQELTWEGKVVWDFRYSSDKFCQHHDIERLPNGNILMIAWEALTPGEAVAAGRNPDLLGNQGLWVDHIIEVKPTGKTTGEVVWEWHVLDHVIQDYDRNKPNYGNVAKFPGRINLNLMDWTKRIPKKELEKLQSLGYIQALKGQDPRREHPDWTHMNSIDYNSELDQILVSVLGFNEIWIIDHSTSTEEAAGREGGRSGKGGGILYRWGNPQAYGRGDAEDQKFFLQHDAVWIPSGYPGSGNILVFNNGTGRPGGNFSSVEEIVPTLDNKSRYRLKRRSAYGPEETVWFYSAPNKVDFFSTNISGSQRLSNGNTLICSGAKGRFFEVTPEKEIVWEYISPFKGKRPQSSHPGLRKPPVKPGAQGFRPPQGENENIVFRCYRYAPDYPGLIGKDLSSKGR